MYTDCNSITRRSARERGLFQLADVHGLQDTVGPKPIAEHFHISTRRCTRIARGLSTKPTINMTRFQLADVHGLQGRWPAHLRRNRLPHFNSPMYTDCKGYGINSRPYPVLCFPFREPHVRGLQMRCTQGWFAQIRVSCWTYFLPGFCRAVPVISASALLSLGKSKRTRLCGCPIL